MNISTSNLDISKCVAAVEAYQKGRYGEAIELLLVIIDDEPKNWDARFYLAISYNNTGQRFAAQRALQFIADHCPSEELKKKACNALISIRMEIAGQKPAASSGDPVRITGSVQKPSFGGWRD